MFRALRGVRSDEFVGRVAGTVVPAKVQIHDCRDPAEPPLFRLRGIRAVDQTRRASRSRRRRRQHHPVPTLAHALHRSIEEARASGHHLSRNLHPGSTAAAKARGCQQPHSRETRTQQSCQRYAPVSVERTCALRCVWPKDAGGVGSWRRVLPMPRQEHRCR
jgi:hypothetical protein